MINQIMLVKNKNMFIYLKDREEVIKILSDKNGS